MPLYSCADHGRAMCACRMLTELRLKKEGSDEEIQPCSVYRQREWLSSADKGPQGPGKAMAGGARMCGRWGRNKDAPACLLQACAIMHLCLHEQTMNVFVLQVPAQKQLNKIKIKDLANLTINVLELVLQRVRHGKKIIMGGIQLQSIATTTWTPLSPSFPAHLTHTLSYTWD